MDTPAKALEYASNSNDGDAAASRYLRRVIAGVFCIIGLMNFCSSAFAWGSARGWLEVRYEIPHELPVGVEIRHAILTLTGIPLICGAAGIAMKRRFGARIAFWSMVLIAIEQANNLVGFFRLGLWPTEVSEVLGTISLFWTFTRDAFLMSLPILLVMRPMWRLMRLG